MVIIQAFQALDEGSIPFTRSIFIYYRGVAQSGSALALGARCRGFESLHPDHLKNFLEGVICPNYRLHLPG